MSDSLSLAGAKPGYRVLLLAQDLHIRVVATATGELLRDLTLDPQPQLPAHRQAPRPQAQNTVTRRRFTVSSMS
ncbi:MAG TPA: hypothetical protein VMU94_28400 [Streptosporangiaceae bacterium]|nr:hypothetical protein [Streptosporangiaceae bacterium]